MTMVTASTSSQAAEALLSRARLLSSNAYERTRSATPTAFAEGEDLIGGSSSLHARTSSSPSLSPISTLATASLHQRHRSSFNDFIRDHNKRRSSVQRLSSGSASSTKTAAQSEHVGSSAVSLGMNATRDEKSKDSRDLQSAGDPAALTTTVVVIEPSTDKLLSTPSSSSTSFTATPLGPSTSSQSFVDNIANSHNTDVQPLAPSACPTSESPSDPSHTLTISTRPRASTDDRENSPSTSLAEGVQPGSATSTLSPVDLHRKHRSENGSTGSGLVLGILEVLRDGEKVSIPLHRTPSTPKLTFSGPSEPQTEPSQLDHAPQPQQSSVPTPTASGTSAAAVVSTTPTPEKQQAQQTQHTQSAAAPAPTSAAPTLPTHDTPAPLPASKPAAPARGSLTVDTAFLNRKTRSESVSTQGSVESCPSPQAASPSVKQARRSSKLFGKLVPKFLQTSFSPSNATGSPRSALPASSSPFSALSTRPGRSASFAGGSSSSMLSGKGSSSGIGSIAEETADKASALPPLPLTLPSLPASVLESGEDWLASSSKTQEAGHTSVPPAPSACSPSSSSSPSNKALESTSTKQATTPLAQEQELFFDYKVEIEYDHEDVDAKRQEQTQEQVNINTFSNDASNTHEREEPASSPYTIDENCDDDFFLNSVLRKKSRPQSPPMLSTGSGAWSAGRTPSLSNSSSSSGSPSPTSPMAPMFAYTSTPLSASPVHSLQYQHYQQQQYQQQQPSRSSTYPSSQIHPGMDEKRSRLRDAVGEWRRSANASSGSMHSPSVSYSSPTVPALAL